MSEQQIPAGVLRPDMRQGEQAAPPARGAQRPAGRGGEAAPRLDKRTYLDEPQARYSVTLRDYGGGLCEVGWAFIPIRPPFGGSGSSAEIDRSLHQQRAVRRARSRLRQLVLSANADHLLTLTYRENVTDFKQACKDLSRFIRVVRTFLPGWVFIAVPEKQKRGAWHWHLAVVGRQDVVQLRASWLRVVGDGNIDVQRPKRGTNRRLSIVTYLGKYLAKGFADGDRELHGHRFRASLGIKVPAESVAIPENLRGEVSAYLIEQVRQRAGSVGFVWVDPTYQAGWACSWG